MAGIPRDFLGMEGTSHIVSAGHFTIVSLCQEELENAENELKLGPESGVHVPSGGGPPVLTYLY